MNKLLPIGLIIIKQWYNFTAPKDVHYNKILVLSPFPNNAVTIPMATVTMAIAVTIAPTNFLTVRVFPYIVGWRIKTFLCLTSFRYPLYQMRTAGADHHYKCS